MIECKGGWHMEHYDELELKVVFFDADDIITASCPTDTCPEDKIDTPII